MCDDDVTRQSPLVIGDFLIVFPEDRVIDYARYQRARRKAPRASREDNRRLRSRGTALRALRITGRTCRRTLYGIFIAAELLDRGDLSAFREIYLRFAFGGADRASILRKHSESSDVWPLPENNRLLVAFTACVRLMYYY